MPLICRSRVNPTAHARPNWHDPTPTQETRALAAGPPVYSDRVPKGQRENPSPISKNQKKEKWESAVRPGSACACRLHRECALGAASPPVGGALSRILAHCAPYIAKSATPAMTRPVAAGNAHTGRTAALSGPHRLEVGCGRSPARINFKKQRKRKGTVGFKSGQHRAAASARVTPFCSHGNESIQGEWPAAALRVDYRPVVLTTRRRRYWRQRELGQNGSAPACVMGDPEFMRIIAPIPYSVRTVGTPLDADKSRRRHVR